MSDNICSICYEELENDVYTIPECSHKFHIDCIATWWRTAHTSCPLCNHNGINYNDGANIFDKLDYRRASHYSRSKNAPEDMKKLYQSIRQKQSKLQKLSNEVNELKQTPGYKETARQVSNKQRAKWRLARTIRMEKFSLCRKRPVIPLIIPIKKQIT